MNLIILRRHEKITPTKSRCADKETTDIFKENRVRKVRSSLPIAVSFDDTKCNHLVLQAMVSMGSSQSLIWPMV